MVDVGEGITIRARRMVDVGEDPAIATTDQEETPTRATGPVVDEAEVRAVILPATDPVRTTMADTATIIRRGVEATTLFQAVLVVEGADTRVAISTTPRLLHQFSPPMARIIRVHHTAVPPAEVWGATVAMEVTAPAVGEEGTVVMAAGTVRLPLPLLRLGMAPLRRLLLPLDTAVMGQLQAMVINRDTNHEEVHPITTRGDEVGAGRPVVSCKAMLKLRYGFL